MFDGSARIVYLFFILVLTRLKPTVNKNVETGEKDKRIENIGSC